MHKCTQYGIIKKHVWVHTSAYSSLTYVFSCICAVPTYPRNLTLLPNLSSPTSLSASWSPPVPKNGIITGYTVYCNTSLNQSFPEQVIGQNIPTIRLVTNGTTQFEIFSTGLDPYTMYCCYVTANTSVGEGSPSVIAIIRTAEWGKANN